MSNDYYGLSRNPFDKHSLSEKDCFQSKDFTETQNRLDFLKEARGIGIITARPGMGKSYALRCFARNLNPNLYHMCYLCLSTVSVSEFYKQFCRTLGLNEKNGKSAMFEAIQKQLYYLFKEKRQPLILAIDEAQYLSTGILNDIKILMNHDYDSLNCFTLILCGEPHLNHILMKPVHEALRQRIVVHYNYGGLSDKEIKAYILHKIRTAGGSETIINESALSAVHGLSQGNPRIIDKLMSDALMLGSQLEKQTIDSEVILAAANNQQLI